MKQTITTLLSPSRRSYETLWEMRHHFRLRKLLGVQSSAKSMGRTTTKGTKGREKTQRRESKNVGITTCSLRSLTFPFLRQELKPLVHAYVRFCSSNSRRRHKNPLFFKAKEMRRSCVPAKPHYQPNIIIFEEAKKIAMRGIHSKNIS